MAGPGVDSRMRILRDAAEQQIVKPLQTHGWKAQIEREAEVGEYLVIAANKSDTLKKVALLYSSGTANTHYKALDQEVDHIFTNGALYQVESFAYGITTPVSTIDDFFPLLVEWNKALAPAVVHQPPKKDSRKHLVITAETPLSGVWARLRQLSSTQISEKLIRRRGRAANANLSQDVVRAKAEGVAYSVRNAADYLQRPTPESLNKRILSLYYGALALAFAEMLASPDGPRDLDEVEGFTKFGHGLYTVPGEADLGTMRVGVVATGFFPRWLSFMGCDVSHFPKTKAKSLSDTEKLDSGVLATVQDLLGSLPELADLFTTAFDAPPSWMVPTYDTDANPPSLTLHAVYRPKQGSTYIHLRDPFAKLTLDRLKGAPWPLAEVTITEPKDGERTFRARVDHPGLEYWHQALPIHHSPFLQRGALILPIFRVVSAYRAVAVALLYSLSIVVRYMPSAWRRVEGGDWDHYLALVALSVDVLERLLPEQFLESITNETVHTRQPGSMF